MPTPTPQGAGAAYEQCRGLLTDQIAKLGPTLRGSLVKRSSRCGNAGCGARRLRELTSQPRALALEQFTETLAWPC